MAQPTDAPFQHIAHDKLTIDLLGVDPLPLISERGIARDHEQVRNSRQIRRQILGSAVRKILLLRVVTDIGKRQPHPSIGAA